MTAYSPLSATAFNPIYGQLQPRFLVKVNGQPFIPKSYEIELNAHGDADTATVVLPIATYPDWTEPANEQVPGTTTSLTLEQLSSSLPSPDTTQPTYVEIWAGFPAQGWNGASTAQLVRRFYGMIDSFDMDHANDETTITCRSLAAPLLTTKITTPFVGQNATTTVAFIQQQAARFGLTTSIILNPGQAPATMQRVLGAEFTTGVRNWSIWQLMLQCAQMDDVDLWVDSQGVLNYCAPGQVQRTTYSYAWLSNISDLKATHALRFSKNIRVEVRSWVKRTRIAHVSRVSTNPYATGGGSNGLVQRWTRTVTSTPIFGTTRSILQAVSPTGTSTTVVESTGGAASSGFTTPGEDSGTESYIFYVSNASPQECDDLAQKIWRQITQHEWMIDMEAPVTPADLGMGVTSLLAISGSPFAKVNQSYWPRQIREVCSLTEGFYRQYTAVNHQNPLGSTSV